MSKFALDDGTILDADVKEKKMVSLPLLVKLSVPSRKASTALLVWQTTTTGPDLLGDDPLPPPCLESQD